MQHRNTSSVRRLIVYWLSVPMMRGAELGELRARMEELAQECGMELVDLVLDTGPPKKKRGDYPVLKRLERGEADVLAAGRSDLRRQSLSPDWLESRLRPQPVALFSVADLARLGVLARRRGVLLVKPEGMEPGQRSL